MLVDTAQEAALRVSALVIVPLVGTPQAQLAQVQQRLIALRAMLADMEVSVVPPVSAQTRVRLGGSPPLQRLQPQQPTVLAVLQARTSRLLALQEQMNAWTVLLVRTLM